MRAMTVAPAREFRNEELSKKDRKRLRAMVLAVRKDRALLLEIRDAELARLTLAGEV